MRGRFLEPFTPHVSRVQGEDYPSSEEGTRQSYLFSISRFATVVSRDNRMRQAIVSAMVVLTFNGIPVSAAQCRAM